MRLTVESILAGIRDAITKYTEDKKSYSAVATARLRLFEWVVEHCNHTAANDKDRFAKLLAKRVFTICTKDTSWDSNLIREVRLSLMKCLGVISTTEYASNNYEDLAYLKRLKQINIELGNVSPDEWDNVFDEPMPDFSKPTISLRPF